MDCLALSTAINDTGARACGAGCAPTAEWQREASAVAELLEVLPYGATLLDMPVGTGRFLDLYYKRGFKVVGRDISPVMLTAAWHRLEELDELDELHRGLDGGWLDCSLELADIQAIPDSDDTYDCALSSRFPNWVDARSLLGILQELRRVSKRYLILGLRHDVPVGDLLSDGPGGARRLVMRHLLGFGRTIGQLARHPDKNASHPASYKKDVVLRTFRALRLRIDARILVERGRDGTDYYFYRLVKQTP